jgi:transcriptional regulator with XRE-family HTH domain
MEAKAKKQRVYSMFTQEAAVLLGKNVELGRKARKLSTTDFANRVGISRMTLQRIEKGDLKCELGFVLEAAALAGVKLFDVEPPRGTFSRNLESVDSKIALLPQRVRKRQRAVVDDAF